MVSVFRATILVGVLFLFVRSGSAGDGPTDCESALSGSQKRFVDSFEHYVQNRFAPVIFPIDSTMFDGHYPIEEYRLLRPRILQALGLEDFPDKVLVLFDRSDEELQFWRDQNEVGIQVGAELERRPSDTVFSRIPGKIESCGFEYDGSSTDSVLRSLGFTTPTLGSCDLSIEGYRTAEKIISEEGSLVIAFTGFNSSRANQEFIKMGLDLQKRGLHLVTIVSRPEREWPKGVDLSAINPIVWESTIIEEQAIAVQKAARVKLRNYLSPVVRVHPYLVRRTRLQLMRHADIAVERAVTDTFRKHSTVHENPEAVERMQIDPGELEDLANRIAFVKMWARFALRDMVHGVFEEEVIRMWFAQSEHPHTFIDSTSLDLAIRGLKDSLLVEVKEGRNIGAVSFVQRALQRLGTNSEDQQWLKDALGYEEIIVKSSE